MTPPHEKSPGDWAAAFCDLDRAHRNAWLLEVGAIALSFAFAAGFAVWWFYRLSR